MRDPVGSGTGWFDRWLRTNVSLMRVRAARCRPGLMRACLSDHFTTCDSDGSSESLHIHVLPVHR
jgi:hypothetical protein